MRVWAGLALVALALTATPVAASDAVAKVECGYDSVNQEAVTGPGHWKGVGYGYATLASPDHRPVTARVTCFLMVNGEARASYGAEGTGMVAFAGPLEFDAGDTDYITACWEVDFLSDDTPTQTGCVPSGCYWPPEGWCHVEFLPVVFDAVFERVGDVFSTTDPATCPVLASLPDTGPVTTDDEGDVSYEGQLVWDCPPFES